jgi:hypothetical protein
MSDPPRWLDDPDQLDDKELSVLTAGRDAAPRAALRGEVWTKLAVRLPIAATVTKAAAAAPHAGTAGLTGSASVAAGGLSAIVKAVAVGATAGSLVMGGVALTSSPAPSPTASGVQARANPLAPSSSAHAQRSASRVTAAPSTARDVSVPLEDLEAATPDGGGATARDGAKPLAHRSAESPEAASSGRTAQRARALGESGGVESEGNANTREESRLVASARERLRARDIAGAERELERAAALFPAGILIQEREALWVEALAARGRTEQAHARAAAFLRAYPRSAHAARVRAIVDW